jgi:hypothetical protein
LLRLYQQSYYVANHNTNPTKYGGDNSRDAVSFVKSGVGQIYGGPESGPMQFARFVVVVPTLIVKPQGVFYLYELIQLYRQFPNLPRHVQPVFGIVATKFFQNGLLPHY